MKKVVCQNKNGKNFRVSANKLSFRPSIYGIILKNKKILLSRQWDGYDFPGGGIEKGETQKEALKREIKEETGLSVEIGELIDCCDSFFKPMLVEGEWHCILIYYLCKNPKGKLTTKNFDEYEKQYASLAEWIPLNKINKLKFYNTLGENNIMLIKKALKIK
jgi:ADP-ribose pyrophosphatase YjhB (NUDIX family)